VADFTIKNLRTDVEDAAPKFGMAPDVEARFAREPLECRNLALSYQRLAPNVRVSFGHKHGAQEEVYVILEGDGRVKLDDEIHAVRQWDAIRVGAGTIRCPEAGPDGMTLLVFGAPKTTPNDAEMFPGWWTD
jgi:mannose-6-phosphate isomerase-like protein (cupin superfamily)